MTISRVALLAIAGGALAAFGGLVLWVSLAPTTVISEGAPVTLVAPPEAIEIVSEPVVDIKPSTPLALSYPEIGVDAVKISGYSNSEVDARGGVNPYTSWDIAWWSNGGRPGTEHTTYLYGHTWHGSTAVFNDLSLAETGDTFEVHTDTGTLTYEVTETFEVSKGFGFTSDPRVLEDSPGRIVIATCDGPPTNIVVIGQLVP